MSTNISVIKFTAKTALALAVLTYATTLNIETNFVYPLAPYISNDLFLTIFGGAFASVLVVLLSEIHQYLYTSVQDLGRLEESESQRLQAVERSERIFADFGSPG